MPDPNVKLGAQVRCARDGSRAILDYLYPRSPRGGEITVDDVRYELKRVGVVAGVDWDAIEDAVNLVLSSGVPARNVLVAQGTAGIEPRCFLGDSPSPCRKEELLAFLQAGKWAGEALSSGDFSAPVAGCRYIKAGERLLFVEQPREGLNIFGHKVPVRSGLKINLLAGQGVHLDMTATDSTYLAEDEGYVAIGGRGLVSIVSPELVSPDRMLLEFVALPVREECAQAVADALIARIKRYSAENAPEIPAGEIREYCLVRMAEGAVEKTLIARGKPPQPGKPGRFDWRIDLSARPLENQEEEKVDYAELSPYVEVGEGDIICEAFPAEPGIPGRDVRGEEIPPPETGDDGFPEAGANIVLEESGPTVLYKAEVSGIVRFDKNVVSVDEAFVVHGDVGAESGNLRFSKDILVEGDLRGGYVVECGGNLTIKGSVENGAKVKCGGNLTILRGVYGQRTEINVSGAAEVGFIQDSRLIAGDKLLVHDYVQDSEVFCRGILTVEGRSVRGDRRGAVMGGHVSALLGLELHSVGTQLARTALSVGVDDRMLAKIIEAEKALPLLAKRMIRLQSSLGFDPSTPAALQRLSRMTPKQKERAKQILLELRETANKRESLQAQVEEMKQKAYADDLREVVVNVQHHVVPSVIIGIGHTRIVVEDEAKSCRFQLNSDGKIVYAR
jgi:uncharacterized protein (DUF342 family)